MAYYTSQLHDHTVVMRDLPSLTPLSLSVYLQASSLSLNVARVGLSRWASPVVRTNARGQHPSNLWQTPSPALSRSSAQRKRLWEATPSDVKAYVLCASAVHESRYARLRVSRYGWDAEPAERLSIVKEVNAVHTALKTVRGAMSVAVCPRIDSWEMVTAALNAVMDDIADAEVREVASAASNLILAFYSCGATVPDLVRAGLPEWAHPLADLGPTKGAQS